MVIFTLNPRLRITILVPRSTAEEGQVCNIPIYEERDSTVILSFTRGEMFPYSIPRPTAEGGVWKYFTKGEGKYNCTVPIFIYRYDILFTGDIHSILSLGRV